MKRWFAWAMNLIDVFSLCGPNLLGNDAPWWVRWPLGAWAVQRFRRSPEMWLGRADEIDHLTFEDPRMTVGAEFIARTLREFAEEAEPGIQRRLWNEREERIREMEAMEAYDPANDPLITMST